MGNYANFIFGKKFKDVFDIQNLARKCITSKSEMDLVDGIR